MAIIEQGILGPFTGHCGNIIGYIRNGQFCIRSMPTHYRDHRSQRQLRNRSRFTLVMKMMSLLRPVINLTFKHLATDMTEMNIATRENYYSLVKPVGNTLRYDYPGLILSRGPVEPLTTPIRTLIGNTLHLHWNAQAIPGAGQDNITILLLNTQRMAMQVHRNIAQRQDGTATIPIPATWNKEEIYSYILVERNNDWSDTHCTGTIPWNEKTNPTPKISKTPAQDTHKPQEPQQLIPKINVFVKSRAEGMLTFTMPRRENDCFKETNPDALPHQTPIKLLFPSPLTREHG